ncbi:hypothetical protein [Tsukamurella tyrosinosolvens]|uniref:hypothetical protein n=1 Tax=Tsukamurella tyrosinosolvens TaxID=57704 RepID=UPI000C7EB2C7|nr:hypothetical protein [Tsukamurella tyrosinosolvens]AUN38630.1 hypothetical protein ASU32_00240 [Tsukamurella tyrosinosolvens]
MPFRRPTAEQQAAAERELTRALPYLLARRAEALAALRSLAHEVQYTITPEKTLGAVRAYRDARRELRSLQVQIACVLVAAGAPTGRVCRELGIGRTTLHTALRKSKYPQLATERRAA